MTNSLRCKAGEMAVISRLPPGGGGAERLGMTLTCLRLLGFGWYGPAIEFIPYSDHMARFMHHPAGWWWEIDRPIPLHRADGEIHQLPFCRDDILTPLRGDLLDDETELAHNGHLPVATL